MSYEIVKKIRIENGKVFITCDSNNVYPKYFREHESVYFNEILNKSGMDALNVSILKAYEEGNFQPGIPNKYSRAIDRLRHTEVYKKYSWRISDYSDNCPIQSARKTKQFDELLLSALNLKPSKEKYIVKKTVCGTDYYVLKVTARYIKVTSDKMKSKIFRIKQDADSIVNMFPEYQLIAL